MGRAPCCEKMGLKKGPWTKEEDRKLINYINVNNGYGNWRALPKKAGNYYFNWLINEKLLHVIQFSKYDCLISFWAQAY